jgi:hypothetical protein
MSTYTPPGWPPGVPPADAPGWERTAAEWLLDLCPADYRGYAVLRKHPLALAWLAGQHVAGARQAMARALATGRAELSGEVMPPVLEQVLGTVEREQARLIAAARGVHLLEQALRGRRFVPRM